MAAEATTSSATRRRPPGPSQASRQSEREKRGKAVNANAKGKDTAISKVKGKGKAADSAGQFLSKSPLPLNLTQRRPAEHDERYHVPLLLSDPSAQDSLLTWFESVRTTRDMAWRKEWTNPSSLSLEDRSRRGYEVLVSETMLQQTRIETVKSYYANWMEKFPTIARLAEANAEEVMAAWRGLGYYSRATRLHTAAKTVHEKYGDVLPSDPAELEKEIAGVGRYTAGAVSSIVYGIATPLLDGNVGRVLSRQMGLHADVKSKAVSDILWRAAELLVVAVSRARLDSSDEGTIVDEDDEGEEGVVPPSATPGRWNQALMELGSTICTPFPRCAECPVQQSCRAYTEGQALVQSQSKGKTSTPPASSEKAVQDIEDICSICEPMPSLEEVLSDLSGDDEKATSGSSRSTKKAKNEPAKSTVESKLKQTTLSFGQSKEPTNKTVKATEEQDAEMSKAVQAHVRQFPFKVAKKKVREEDAVVCIIEVRPASGVDGDAKAGRNAKRKGGASGATIHPDSLFLIQQRPDKGLLASMWEMPTHIYTDDDPNRTDQDRVKAARTLTQSILKKVGLPDGSKTLSAIKTSITGVDMLGLHTHVFSHLKMHMHAVHVVLSLPELDDKKTEGLGGGPEGKWVARKALEEDYSMGNGMRTCWAMLSG
ncbi:hypothetical protein CF327_g6603 [Tilletia walkeri]|nr:hypothetical protein CF327_g6603 [Tilletia walkeri]